MKISNKKLIFIPNKNEDKNYVSRISLKAKIGNFSKQKINKNQPKFYLNMKYLNKNNDNNQIRYNSLGSKNTKKLNKKKSYEKKKSFDIKKEIEIVKEKEKYTKKNLNAKIKILSRQNYESKNTGKQEYKIRGSTEKEKYIKLNKISSKSPYLHKKQKKNNDSNYTKNSSKLRIVSKDKTIKKHKLIKNHIKIKDISNRSSSKAKKQKQAKNFLKLKIGEQSRSIDMKKPQKKTKGHRKDFLSEDKNHTNFVANEKKTFNFNTKDQNLEDLNEDIPISEKKKNKYYRYLLNKMNKNKLAHELIKKVCSSFKKWQQGERADFFNFKTNIGFYKIIQKIGKGCFGKVYLAQQILTSTYVALKVIPKTSIKTKNSMKKIKKEVKILKMINNNSNVIKLFEVFDDDNYVYMVFEFVEKGDLVHYFKKNPLFEERELKKFFAKIIRGIKYLHKNSILHRDLKLDNILLDKLMSPKICDFGISSIWIPNKKIYDTGGTPAYLAPEVIKAQGEVQPKSDVWSLGVLLFLLSFGYVPFKANDMQILYNKIIIGKYKVDEDHNLSDSLIDLIKKMLVVNIKDRIGIDDVIKHSWMGSVRNMILDKNYKRVNDKDKEKIKAINWFLLDLGFHKEFIRQSINMNLFNHVKACRNSLFIKLNIDL